MDNYIIKKAYHWTNGKEIEIDSKNLTFVELSNTHHGLQCNNLNNHDIILNKCSQIAGLIREIDKLNKL